MENTKYLEWDEKLTVEQWTAKFRIARKTELVECMGDVCGYGLELVRHWIKNKTYSKDKDELYEATKAAYDNDLIGGFFYEVLENWHSSDWRGKKGQLPSPNQIFEHALKYRHQIKQAYETQKAVIKWETTEISLD